MNMLTRAAMLLLVLFGSMVGLPITSAPAGAQSLNNVLLWDPRFPTREPWRIVVTDPVAAAISADGNGTVVSRIAAASVGLSLGGLSLSPTNATAGVAYSGTISGKTSGSVVTATSSDGTALTVSGGTIGGIFAAAGPPTITLTETLAGAVNSPRVSTASLTVNAATSAVYRLVGTGGREATGQRTLGATYTKWRNRSVSTLRSDATRVTFVVPLCSVDDSFATQCITFPAGTTLKAQIDVGLTNNGVGTTYPAYTAVGGFAQQPPLGVLTGNTGTSVALDGTNTFAYFTLTAAQAGVAKFTAGTILAVSEEVDFAAATTTNVMPLTDSTGTGSTSTSGENFFFGGTTSMGIAGAMAANGGVTGNYALRPIAVVGDGTVSAVAINGDSITAGKGAGRPAQDGATSASGFAAFALWQSGRPFTVLGKNGERAATWANLATTDFRYQVQQWVDVSGVALGTNDLSGVSDSGAQAIADHRAMRAKLASMPTPGGAARKIFATNTPPRTTNTNYVNTADELVQSGYLNTDAAFSGFDAALRADVGTSGRNLGLYVDVRSAYGDTVQSDRFAITDSSGNKVQTGGVAHSIESDGTHPTAAGAALAATPVVNGLATFIPQ